MASQATRHLATAMCDKLIHDYFGVDLPTVWLAPQDDLPVPKAKVTQILKEL